MLLQWYIALGLLLAAKGASGVLADEAQHPISESDHGIQTSSACHNAASPISLPLSNHTRTNTLSAWS